jgi:hypothetical protein
MVTYTLMIVTILGFAALATDVGMVYWQQRQLQNGVDGAALAGASALETGGSSQAISLANTYANYNGVTNQELSDGGGATVGTTFNSNDTVIVTAKRINNFGLRYLIGAGNTNILTQAAAIVTAMSPSGVWPVGLSQGSDCSLGCVIKHGAGSSDSGNFGFLDLDGKQGSGDVGQYILTGYTGTIPPPSSYNGTTPVWDWTGPYSEPGNKVSGTDSFQTLMNWDQSEECDGGVDCSKSGLWQLAPDCSPTPGLFCSSALVRDKYGNPMVCYTDVRCPRVGLVPIISQQWSSMNGKSAVDIIGFECMYILSYTDAHKGPGQVVAKSLGACYASSGGGAAHPARTSSSSRRSSWLAPMVAGGPGGAARSDRNMRIRMTASGGTKVSGTTISWKASRPSAGWVQGYAKAQIGMVSAAVKLKTTARASSQRSPTKTATATSSGRYQPAKWVATRMTANDTSKIARSGVARPRQSDTACHSATPPTTTICAIIIHGRAAPSSRIARAGIDAR